MEIKVTERGWAGHFICSPECNFRRNTLLEYGEIRIVVSTVGAMLMSGKNKFEEVGLNRYYETMAFHAKWELDCYWEADVEREIYFDSAWMISHINSRSDRVANDMHERVVLEIKNKLLSGEKF